jgi:tetratricopeptide (TPR) repeat protein
LKTAQGGIMKKSTIIVLIILIASMVSRAQEPILNFTDAKASAAKYNKPILVEFYTIWAPACEEFNTSTKSNDAIKKALESVVLYQADMDQGDGKYLARKFKLAVSPSFIIFNANGDPIDRWFGYDDASFAATLNDALEDRSTISEMVERFKKDPTVKDAAALGRWHLAYGDCKKAAMYYQNAQKLNSDPTVDYSYEIFMSIACGFLKKDFTFDQVKQAADEVLRSKNELKWEVYDASQRMVTLSLDNNRRDLIAGYIKGGLDATSDTTNPVMAQSHDQFLVIKMLFIDGDTARAIRYQKASMPEGWQNQAYQLNEFAQWCLGAHVDLAEGESSAQKAISLAHPGREKAIYFDTLADIYHADGNFAAAVDYTKKAITEDPDNEDYPFQLTYYEQLANSKK